MRGQLQVPRHHNLDVARSASAIAVVWLHVASEVLVADPSVTSLNWWIGNAADSLSRWCVPVFVMLSGALLIPKARTQTPLAFVCLAPVEPGISAGKG